MSNVQLTIVAAGDGGSIRQSCLGGFRKIRCEKDVLQRNTGVTSDFQGLHKHLLEKFFNGSSLHLLRWDAVTRVTTGSDYAHSGHRLLLATRSGDAIDEVRVDIDAMTFSVIHVAASIFQSL